MLLFCFSQGLLFDECEGMREVLSYVKTQERNALVWFTILGQLRNMETPQVRRWSISVAVVVVPQQTQNICTNVIQMFYTYRGGAGIYPKSKLERTVAKEK